MAPKWTRPKCPSAEWINCGDSHTMCNSTAKEVGEPLWQTTWTPPVCWAKAARLNRLPAASVYSHKAQKITNANRRQDSSHCSMEWLKGWPGVLWDAHLVIGVLITPVYSLCENSSSSTLVICGVFFFFWYVYFNKVYLKKIHEWRGNYRAV